MSTRTVQAGDVIDLRAQFKDDTDELIQATDVYVHIFEPGVDTSDLGNAVTVSGVPTYLGQGLFEYEYTTPTVGPGGVWHDVWEGSLPSQDLYGILGFEVVTSGLITEFDDQLFANNLIEVIIPSGIQALDGSSVLDEEYTFEFLTTTSPSYSNLRRLRLEIGGFLDGVSDIALQSNILEASIEADILTFTTVKTNTALYEHARRQYVTCMAASMTLGNLSSYMLKSKTLGDLSVQYDTAGLQNAMNDLKDCLAKWEPQLLAGGGAKSAASPSGVVKGALDPDRPIASRMWASTEAGSASQRIPAANTRVRPAGKRRASRTFTKNKKWW